MNKTLITTMAASVAAAALAFSLAACGASKATTENVETDEVAAQEAEIAQAEAAGALDEQQAVGIAFDDLGITESDGVVVLQNADHTAFEITIMLGTDAHFYEVSAETGQIQNSATTNMDELAIDGFRAEELAQEADGANPATNYKCLYDTGEGWGWRVDVAGSGALSHYYVNGTTGAVKLLDSVTV